MFTEAEIQAAEYIVQKGSKAVTGSVNELQGAATQVRFNPEVLGFHPDSPSSKPTKLLSGTSEPFVFGKEVLKSGVAASCGAPAGALLPVGKAADSVKTGREVVAATSNKKPVAGVTLSAGLVGVAGYRLTEHVDPA
ncbi:hypothetical protein FRB98_004278 [Tulasnella sp. 332]|nr:hypothetical protein FRB98_004278 [Tulasnella sp. 332]